MSDKYQEAAIKELMAESPTIARWFRNHGTDYMSMPKWIRDRLTQKTKAVEEVWFQIEMECVQDWI